MKYKFEIYEQFNNLGNYYIFTFEIIKKIILFYRNSDKNVVVT